MAPCCLPFAEISGAGGGSGAPPRFGQLVRFHYVGYIASEDGESLEAYDSSYERNTPYFTKHGNGLTCEGLEEALHTMRPGGRRRVLLPPSLGYSRGSASDKGPLPVKATDTAGGFRWPSAVWLITA